MNIYKQMPYFYIIEDKRNGMYYAGCQYSKNSNPNMLLKEDGYKTTSKTVRKIIKEYGVEIFKIRKIKTFLLGKDAHEYETRFLKKIDARRNPKFYNGHNNDYKFNDNTGFVSLIDETGKTFRLLKTDPLINSEHINGVTKGMKPGILEGSSGVFFVNDSRWKSGELRSPNEGKSNYIDPITGKHKIATKDEAKVLGLVSFSLGFISVKDKEGNTKRVRSDDPRIKSGELFGATKGFAIVKDSQGNVYSIQKDDPRIKSGEFVSINAGKTMAIDLQGNKIRVDKNDPRFITGELKGISFGMSFYNNGEINKCFRKTDKIPEGFILGRMKKIE
jgi:hypothetical protein